MKKLAVLTAVLLLAVPIHSIAEETTVTETFNDQKINTDIDILYGGNDTEVAAATTASPECANTSTAGSIGIEDLDCFGSEYFSLNRHALGIRGSSDSITIAFPNEPYEVGFQYGATDVDNISGTVYYDNGASETFTLDQHTDYTTVMSKSWEVAEGVDTFITEIVIDGLTGENPDWYLIDNIYYKYDNVPTTTTSSSTTTTTTTTTTTLPKAKDVVEDGITTYLAWDENGCEHPDNPLSYKQYLEAVESKKWFGYQNGDCKEPIVVPETTTTITTTTTTTIPPTEEELNFLETGIYETDKERADREEAERLEAEKEAEIKAEIQELDLDIPEEEVEEFVEVVKEVEEFVESIVIEEEIIELPEEIIIIVEEVEEDDIVIVVEDEEVVEEVLDEPIQEDVEEKPAEELSEEEVVEAVSEVEEIVEEIIVEEATTEEVIEVIEQVNDVGVQNLDKATEEVQEVVQEIVEEAIENVEELTQEQVEVVAEVLQVETEDVAIVAEAIKSDEVVAEAVEEYVERAVENADVENYTLADVVTEVQYEAFLENPIEVFIDVDIQDINLTTIGDDMTQDQREKAQEVVVPVILTRIVSIAAFVVRKSL